MSVGIARSCLAVLALFTCASLSAQPIKDFAVLLRINGASTNLTVPAVQVEGLGWLMSPEDFAKLGLTRVKPYWVTRGNEDLVSINRTKGLAGLFNERTVELNITAGISLFEPQMIEAAQKNTGKEPTRQWGGYLNYDFSASRSTSPSEPTLTTRGALFEGVVFSPMGSLISQQVISNDQVTGKKLNQRLDTYFQTDFIARNLRLRVGDNISSSGSWGRSIRYGGIRLGTDFTLRPDLVVIPGLTMAGSSAVPSTVDIFVNGALQGRYNLAPGQFNIDRVPVISGAGNVRMIVRNVLGQEQSVDVPFFCSTGQLRSGLVDYAIEFGRTREGFATEQDQYADRFAQANIRYGFNDWLTVEGRAEWSEQLRSIGLGTVTPLGFGHLLTTGFAASEQQSGQRGWAGVLGYSFTGQALRLAARVEKFSANFSQLGMAAGEIATERRISATLGYRIGRSVDLGLGYSQTLLSTGAIQEIASLNVSTQLRPELTLSSYLSYVNSSGALSKNLGLQLYWSIDRRTYGSSNYQFSSAQVTPASSFLRDSQASIRLGQRSNDNAGLSWQLEAANDSRFKVRSGYQADEGEAQIEHEARGSSSSTQRLSVGGSVIAAGGKVALARNISDSFIMVVGDPTTEAKIIKQGGQRVALNRAGVAVLDRVAAYQEQRVVVDSAKLPLDVVLGSNNASAVVPSRAGAVVKVEARRLRPATLKLVFQGRAVGLNTKVKLNGELVILGEEGLVFASNVLTKNTLEAEWTDNGVAMSCKAEFEANGIEVMADLGTIDCN